MLNNHAKCIVKEEDNRKACSNEIVTEIKVTLYHPDSERRSKQNWFLCKKHYNKFIEDDGKGWYRWYNNKENVSPIIDYDVILDIENLTNLPIDNGKKIQNKK